MKKPILIAIFGYGSLFAQEKNPPLFRQNSWELTGTLSGGRSTVFGVYDASNSGSTYDYSSYNTAYNWYLDFSPAISFFPIDNLFVYLSPELNISKSYQVYSPLFPNNPGPGQVSSSTYGNDLAIEFHPFLGVGHVFQITEKVYLSTSFDIQRTQYYVMTKLNNSAPANYSDARPSLTRFNLRLTPKIMIRHNLFLNFSLIVYYETDRLLASMFRQKGYGASLYVASATYNIGMSYLFN